MTNQIESTNVSYPDGPSNSACETAVLDLSVQKSPSPSPKHNFEKGSLGSPLQGSVYPEMFSHSNTEPNNNDSKSSNFQTPMIQSHSIHLPAESYTSHTVNSAAKRKSPGSPGIEGTRFDRLTPPLENNSPTKGLDRVPPLHGSYYPAYPCLYNPYPPTISIPPTLHYPPTLTNPTFGSPPGSDSSSLISESYPTHSANIDSDELKKITRPFKAFPKEPLSTLDMISMDEETKKNFLEFRNSLESRKRTTEGTNIKMRRTTKNPNMPCGTVDESENAAYRERRRKNNEAAKRSRDARRQKEDEIAIRAVFFEKMFSQTMTQNRILTEELNKKEAEISQLKHLLAMRQHL